MTRKEAIEFVKEAFIAWESEYRVPHEDWTETHKARDMAIEALSAERTGKWAVAYLDHESIGVRPKTLYCSECNWLTSVPSAWCPNCGAKMDGGKNE